MIRRSTAIATTALFLSLFVHLLGLSFSSPLPSDSPPESGATDVVALGNAFEDIAEGAPEPVEPEAAEVPEPPTETPPEPDFADIPATEALVASPDPQNTTEPGANSAAVEPSEAIEPSEPDQSATPQPETVEPSGGEGGAVAERAVTPPANSDTAESAVSPPAAQAPVPRGALPVQITAVTPPPETSAVPVIPLALDAVEPETAEVVEPVPETPETTETENDVEGSELAVVSSPRPQLPSRRPIIEPEPTSEEVAGSGDDQATLGPIIESPLTAYLRDGTDLKIRQNNGAGSATFDSRTPGNSGVTNYAGRVLMQLNRVPTARISARGYARVYFQINADGTLARVDIIDGSGSREIYDAAKQQVRDAAPFPPPPDGASRKLTFVYSLE